MPKVLPCLILFLFGFLHLQAQTTSLSFGIQDSIESRVLNETQQFSLYLPESFHEASEHHTYPVLLLLEDEFFFMTCGVVRHLSSVERMPETMVVGISDMSYIPTVYTNGSTFWSREQITADDPDLFTDYLEQELFPYLESNYQANDFRMVMGLSPTALYVLHSFVKEPELFDAHIAIAAGDMLGMGYGKGERFIELITEEVKRAPNQKHRLYVTSADGDGGGNSPEIGTNLQELDQSLTSLRSENLQYVSKLYPNEGHYDVALPALTEALELIFPKEKWFARYRDIVSEPGNALENIDAYYAALSQEYGFTILPRAERWNSVNRLSWIGPYLIRQERVAEGIEVIKRWTAYRPNSELAFSTLAKAYASNDQVDLAISAQRQAYNLALSQDSVNANEYLLYLQELEGK